MNTIMNTITRWTINRPEIARNPASPTSPNSPTSPKEPNDKPVAAPVCRLVWPDGRPHRFHPMAGCWSCEGGTR